MRKILKSLALLYLFCGLLIGCSTETTDNSPTPETTFSVIYNDGVPDAEITVPVDTNKYHEGDEVTVKFDGIGTRTGYTFTGWVYENTTFTSDGITSFKMGKKSVALMAQWSWNGDNPTPGNPPAIPMYSITIIQGITNGTVTSNKNSASSGETVSLTVTPNAGYQLDTLTVTGADGVNVQVSGNAFIMPPKNVVVNATFTALPPSVYSVNVTNGTANPSSGSQGTLITLTANTPATGKEFDTWATNTSGVTFANANSASTTFTMPSNNVSISATYKNINYSINIANGITHGTVSSNVSTAVYGATVSLTATPNTGYQVSTLSVIDEDGTNVPVSGTTFTMPAKNVVVNAAFTELPRNYSIIYTNPQYGNISTNTTTATRGTRLTFSVEQTQRAFVVDAVNVFDSAGNALSVIFKQEFVRYADLGLVTKVYEFIMPESDVTISATMKRFVYQFHDSVTVLPEGTDGSGGTNCMYVYFGDYPQTIKPNNVTVNTSTSKRMGNFTYYKGSDEYWYQQIQAQACPKDKYNQNTAQQYSNVDYVPKSSTLQWFKVEPIKWRVLKTTTNGKLLLSDVVLTGKVPFCYDSNNQVITVNSKKIYPNNYTYSDIRAYLNGMKSKLIEETSGQKGRDYTNSGFIQQAFSATAQELIIPTTINNGLDSIYTDAKLENGKVYLWQNNGVGQYRWIFQQYDHPEFICENTVDKIFLLSNVEAKNIATLESTDYAKANYVLVDSWMTRSPMLLYKASGASYSNNYHTYVKAYDASYLYTPNDTCMGIRPALCVNFLE